MNDMQIIRLEELRKVVEDLATETRNEYPGLYFDYAGLIPVSDKSFRYDCTPINTEVFAMTGGDGVHFSMLELSGKEQPIVMTVPMNFGDSMRAYNWIVGANLNEFLSIGYYNGWFSLEQLCYDIDWLLSFYAKENLEDTYQKDADIQFVKKLRSKFGFDHIPLTKERLSELEDMYFQYLRFDSAFIEKYIGK